MTDFNGPAWRPSRRDLLYLGIGGLVAAVPFARRAPLALVRRHAVTMGTIAEFAVAHRDPAAARAAIDEAIAALRAVDATMSRFNPASDIGRANAGAARGAVTVCDATREVVAEAVSWAEASGGRFDPCLGRVSALWDIPNRHEPPASREIAPLAGRRLFRGIDIGARAGSAALRFTDADVQIDLGGIAKGYGVDRAARVLRERGIEHALIGAGGDLYALGRSPSGEPWQVGIQSPDHPRALAGSIALENAAIATSGDYQQYFVYRARRYHHLMDPSTAAPWQAPRRSISVIADSCMAADAGATCAFGMAPAEAARVLGRRGARVAHEI